MSEAEEILTPIPKEWRERVTQILRSGDRHFILSTTQSNRDWSAAFPDAWDFNRWEALASALDIPGGMGRHILDMEPPCDAYEFWFSFRGRKLIGKIGLLPEGKIIIVFSSHIPRKGEERL